MDSEDDDAEDDSPTGIDEGDGGSPTNQEPTAMRSHFGEGVYGWTTRKAMHHFGLADEQQEAWVAAARYTTTTA